MYSINDQQIDYILNDIRRRGVEMEDLQSNLLDHICCIVEQNLKSDGDFEDFYKKTIPKFFKHELWEIEEETILLLTYKNYYTMKKAMILSGNISLALIATGTVFKIFHWPGAALALILGFAILCFLFFPSAIYLNHKSEQNRPLLNLSILFGGIIFMLGVLFKVMHWPGTPILLLTGWSIILGLFLPIFLFGKLKETNSGKEKSIYILGAISLIIFEAATMFKFFHWPGAGPLMILGSVTLIGLFVPLFTNMKLKKKEMNAGQFIFAITLSMYAIVFTVMLSMNVSGPVLERFVKDDSNSAKILNYFEKKEARLLAEQKQNIDSVSLASLDKQSQIMIGADKLSTLISNLKADLIQAVEGVDKNTATTLIAKTEFINAKSNHDKVDLLLLGPNGNASLKALKEELEKFRGTAGEVVSSKPEVKTRIDILLNTSDTEINGQNLSWEERSFRNNLLIGSLAQLSELEKNVRMVESEALCLIK